MINYLAGLAPICAIIGLLFIMIKAFAPKHVRSMMCAPVMILSGVASLLYLVRLSGNFSDSFSPVILAIIWAWIGFLNYLEYSSMKRNHGGD